MIQLSVVFMLWLVLFKRSIIFLCNAHKVEKGRLHIQINTHK